MEIEVSGDSFDCSRYWLIALVADNSHVFYLDWSRPQMGARRLVLSLLMPPPIGLRETDK